MGGPPNGTSIHQVVEDLLGERIEALASWIQELDAQVRATSAAGDEKTLKELRKALEAWTKRDPKFEERLTERVDVLADRLATLSSTVNTTAAARASSEGEIAGLRRELEQETAKLNATLQSRAATDVSKELQELRRAVAGLGRAPRGNGDGAASREEIENLAVRVDMLAKTVATTAAGLAGREGDLATLRRSLDEANTKIEQVGASMPRASQASDIARLDAKLGDLAQKVSGATRAMAERESGTAQLRTRAEEQGAKLEALSAALQKSIRAIEARLAEVAAKDDGAAAVAALDARVVSLTERLAAGDPRYEGLEAQLEGLSSQLGDASAERAASVEEIAALRRQVEDSGRRFDAAVTELRALVDALPTEPPLAEVETRLAPLRAQVEGLAAKVDESGTRFEGALAELRHLVDALPTESPAGALEAVLAPLQAQVDGLAARAVEDDARITERLERETSRASALDQQLGEVDARLEDVASKQVSAAAEADAAKSAWELERAWVREQMDALVSAVADTASRADVEPVVGNLERRLEELASEQSALTAEIARTRETLLAETERLQTQLRELPEPAESADLEPLVNELASRLEEVARRQSAEIARTHDALRSEIEGLDARLQEFPAASESQATLELLVSDLACRLEEVTARQSTGAAEITRTHDALRSEIEGLEAKLRELPDPAPPVPPSEDEQLKRLLTAFADRIDAMERERAAIAGEASEAAQSWVDQVRPLVEGLRRRLDESDRRLEALGSTEGLTARLEELAERMQALEERPVAPPQPAPLPGDGRLRVELRALELRMQHAEAAARENREAVLVQLERLASRIEWRLQRLESGEQTEPEGAQEEPSLGQVVPLRGGAET